MKIFYPFNVIRHYIYLLQLENYHPWRFARVSSYDMMKVSFHERKGIEWTHNLIGTSSFAGALWGGLYVITVFILNSLLPGLIPLFLGVVFLFIVFAHLFFVSLFFAVLILSPLNNVVTQNLMEKARRKVRANEYLHVIAIAGSYGKTTMKEFITAVLHGSYRVLSTRGNENTPAGISRVILSSLTQETQVLVLEMGEFAKGDVRALCSIATPDVAVVTGINEAHLERMGNLKNTIDAVFEVVEHSTADALVLLNADDVEVIQNYERYTRTRETIFYGKRSGGVYEVIEKHFDPQSLTVSYSVLRNGSEVGTITSKLLGGYVAGNIEAALSLAEAFSVSFDEAKERIEALEPVEHRLQGKRLTSGITLIDDSYNGNPEGVEAALGVLERFPESRKVYITPGLIELGPESDRIHRELGRKIAEVADVVFLIRTSATRYMYEGLRDKGFNDEKIVWFEGMLDSLDSFNTFLKKGDVVLIQNDWPDNYR